MLLTSHGVFREQLLCVAGLDEVLVRAHGDCYLLHIICTRVYRLHLVNQLAALCERGIAAERWGHPGGVGGGGATLDDVRETNE